MTPERAQKFSYIVNTVILFIVFGLMAFFYQLHAEALVYFSIPTICIYLFGYLLIYKNKLDVYVWTVYLWITLYMGITTVCLGYGFGFHLYCMSMIPVMYVTEYLAYKLEQKSLKALYVCAAVCVIYMVCTGYVSYYGPVYKTDESAAGLFWLINSLIVFGFLIFYTNWLIKLIIQSEERLKEMAHIDKLTGLNNRHYMMEILEKAEKKDRYLAIADIDLFKQINDQYGHNAGDYVLRTLADLLKENNPEADVCRWGGEEFLILAPGDMEKGREEAEIVRKKVEDTDFTFDGKKIKVTITIGLAIRGKEESIDKWIQRADEKLYYGKEHGRNRVETE